MFLNLLLTLFFFGLCNSQGNITHQKLNKIYYKIPAEKSLKIPFVMSKEIDYFEVYSERNAFEFEVVISKRRQKICKEEQENPNDDVFSLPSFCRHKLVNLFSHNIIYKIFMFPDAFDFPDILQYNGFTFTEFTINNTGLSDFHVRIFIMPGSNAPISLLNRCGINNRKLIQNQTTERRVEAYQKDWPWMAALLERKDALLLSLGVLITDRYVLADALSFKGRPKEEVKVRLGGYDISTLHKYNPSDIPIERILIPDSFNVTTDDYYVVLVKLERPASFSKFISPVCLPPRSETLETRNGIFVGFSWWEKEENKEIILYLMEEISVPIWRRNECEAANPGVSLTDNQFCTGPRKDICKDKLKGPFLIQQPDLSWHVLGLAHYSLICFAGGSQIVYFNVSHYLDWIQTNIET